MALSETLLLSITFVLVLSLLVLKVSATLIVIESIWAAALSEIATGMVS